MARINISYLIALGLLGAAVASKYTLSSTYQPPNSGDKRSNPH